MADAAEPTASDVPRRVIVQRGGPTLIEGPVSVEKDGKDPVVLDRFLVALCACRGSESFPLCDGTHRRALRRTSS